MLSFIIYFFKLNREIISWINSLSVRMAAMVVYRFGLSVVARVQARPIFNHITTSTVGMFSITRGILNILNFGTCQENLFPLQKNT